jgi:glucose/mannose-6-phosphate isomerase
MIEEKDVKRFDQKRLYSVYANWNKHFKAALELRDFPSLSHPVEHYELVVFCGMGGSATNCDVIQEIMNAYGIIPSSTVRNEQLPAYVNERSLVIVNSVSGDTEETLLMMRDAINHGADVICISSGGKLKEEASGSKRCQHIEIPNLFLPRASLPYLLIPGLKIINPFLNVSLQKEIASIPGKIDNVIRSTAITVLEENNVAKKIGRFMRGGFPFCYSSPALLPAATRFKNSLNENAKIHCISESILEASHNDIVPFTFSYSVQTPKILLLRWNHDNSVIRERFDKVRALFEKVVQPAMEISMSEDNLLASLVSAIYILDLSTIYMAISKNTDPSPTPAIQILKDV